MAEIWMDPNAWLLLMSDTVPDWARVRKTAKEPPKSVGSCLVMAWNLSSEEWMEKTVQQLQADPEQYPYWHYPAPIPKEPSPFYNWWKTVEPVATCETSMTREELAKAAWDAGSKDNGGESLKPTPPNSERTV